MKRALALVLILVMFFTFSGFGSKISNTPAEAPAAETANSIPDGFETSSYIYESSYGDTTFFLVIKNNTDSAVSISGNALAKDANGGSIGAGNFSVDVLGPGEETITYSYFNNVSGVDSVSFQMVTKTEPRYTPVLGSLDVKRFDNGENVSLSVTNNGSVGAQFVEAYALFMDADNNVVRYASTYLTDVDNEIKPGETLYGQLDSYDSYDHALVYLTGRSDGKANHTEYPFDAAQLSVREFWFESRWGDTYVFLAVTNNSDTDVAVQGNAAALDAAGNVLGAGDLSIDVIGPGQESIGYFYFDDVTGVDHVDYKLQGDPDSYYVDIIAGLEGDASINNNNVVISLTNNGPIPAKFVQVYALFFDANDNMVDWDYVYVTDDDNEIKPGSTLSAQLDTNEAFDYAELFITGRGSK